MIYMEPEKQVMSRSADECVVALCDQWWVPREFRSHESLYYKTESVFISNGKKWFALSGSEAAW